MMGDRKHGTGTVGVAGGVRLAVAAALIASSASAGAAVLNVVAHGTEIVVAHANLSRGSGGSPTGGERIGDAAGSGGDVWRFAGTDPNGAVVAADGGLEKRGEVTGVLESTGSYFARTTSSAGPLALSHAADATLVTANTGQFDIKAPAPQINVDMDTATDFTVSADTSARVEAVLFGNTGNVGASNFVGLQLTGSGIEGVSGGTTLLINPLAYARTNETALHVVDADVELDARRTYTIRADAGGRHAATFVDNPPPSSISYNLLLSQDLTGNSETNSLKPNETTEAGHRFLLDGAQLDSLGGSTVWIDPEVAIGFDYLIDGAGVLGITLPSFSVFPELDYQLFDLGGALLAELTSGASFTFASAVSGFSLRGISESLALDPTTPGFTLGLSFDTASRSTVLVTQSPITTTVGPVGVPTPGMGSLVLAGLGALFLVRRRRH